MAKAMTNEWVAQFNTESQGVSFLPETRLLQVTPTAAPELTFKHTLPKAKRQTDFVEAAAGCIASLQQPIAVYLAARKEAEECGFSIVKGDDDGFYLVKGEQEQKLPVGPPELLAALKAAVEQYLNAEGEPKPVVSVVSRRRASNGVNAEGFDTREMQRHLALSGVSAKSERHEPDSDNEMVKHLLKNDKIRIPARALQNNILKYFEIPDDARLERDEFIDKIAAHASNLDATKLTSGKQLEQEYKDFMHAVFAGTGTLPQMDAPPTDRIIDSMAAYLKGVQEQKLGESRRFASNVEESFREDMNELLQTLHDEKERAATSSGPKPRW